MKVKVTLLLSVLALSGLGAAQVQPSFFGMHVNKLVTFPVPLPFTSIRLWDTGTNWFQICPDSDYSRCDWQRLDKFLAAAKANGVSEVLYTFGKTPAWISSEPRGDCWGAKEGVCYPPRDLSSDGKGSDAAFQGFVRAIVEHNRRLDPSTYAHIKFWGIWNEPHTKQFWRGTVQQMVRMTKDAREIIKAADPDALVLTPEPASNAKHSNYDIAGDWMDEFLSAGGGAYVDVIAFHIYPNNNEGHPVPEEAVKMINQLKSKLARHPEVAGKPLWMTEGSWGRNDDTNWGGNPDHAAAFLMRYETLLAAEGIQRAYWYCLDAGWGNLSESGFESGQAAYRTMHDWLLGRTVTNCSSKSHVWSCTLEGPNFKGSIVWHDEYDKTTSFDPKGFTAVREAGRDSVALDPKVGRLTLGNKPVLLEAAAAGGR